MENPETEITWIAEIPCREIATMIVRAKSRKEAEHKLRHRSEYMNDFDGCGSRTEFVGVGKIVGRDGEKK